MSSKVSPQADVVAADDVPLVERAAVLRVEDVGQLDGLGESRIGHPLLLGVVVELGQFAARRLLAVDESAPSSRQSTLAAAKIASRRFLWRTTEKWWYFSSVAAAFELGRGRSSPPR